jgi:hypothetical protein
MKLPIVLVLAAGWGARAAGPAQLGGVQKVYLMPMAGGLDQHLADQLSRHGLFTVVVDPKQADAVWSERVDAVFFERLTELYPPPGGPQDQKKDETLESARPPARGTWARGRGTVFLVDVASRQVLWSTFLDIEDASPKGMQRKAQELVKRLRKDLKRE